MFIPFLFYYHCFRLEPKNPIRLDKYPSALYVGSVFVSAFIMITVLCVAPRSNYHFIPNLDLYTEKRNAYTYCGRGPVITHAPCQQWSRLKHFAKGSQLEKDLAVFCFEKVQQNGGIFEHPAGSSFFKYVGADYKKIISVNQSWWNFPATKRTYLYFNKITPLSHPLSFDCSSRSVVSLTPSARSRMPLAFCQWLVGCISVSSDL